MTGDAYLILLVILSIAAVSSCAAYLVSLGTREERGGVGTIPRPFEPMPKPDGEPDIPRRPPGFSKPTRYPCPYCGEEIDEETLREMYVALVSIRRDERVRITVDGVSE